MTQKGATTELSTNHGLSKLVSLTKEITIYNNSSLVCQGNLVAAIVFYLHVFNTHLIKRHNYTCDEVIFNQQMKVT